MDLEKIVQSYREEIIRSTQEILRIPSVEGEALPSKPFGQGIADALDYALELSEKLGFKTQNFDHYVGHCEYGEGEEVLGILVHLDVVPEGTGWTYPPYGAEIHDGRIYARGAIDDKGPAIAALYALKAVADAKIPLSKKVRIIFGCDEESGWKDIEYYKTQEKMPDFGISPDGGYPIINTEKGIVHLTLSKSLAHQEGQGLRIKEFKGGTRANVVPNEANCTLWAPKKDIRGAAEKFTTQGKGKLEVEALDGRDWLIRSFGVSAHGSTPEKGVNAVSVMLEFLNSLGLGDSDGEQCIQFLAQNIGMQHHGEGLGVALADAVSGKLSLNLGVIDMDENHIQATIDIRYPVTFKEEKIVSTIQGYAREVGMTVETVSSQRPLHVPEEHFLVQKLKEVYSQITGHTAYTIAIGGGTYARALDNAVAFGPLLPGKPEMAHQRDEYIEIEDLMLNARIYAKTIAELAR